MKTYVLILTLSLAICNSYYTIYAQSDSIQTVLDHDTTYYKSYNTDLHLRLYSVYKFNSLVVTGNNNNSQRIVYSPNGNLNLGFGFTYRGLGVNIGLNFPFINDDNDKYGETNKLDMRTYVYGRKVAIDVGVQFYNGFYVTDSQNLGTPNSKEPTELRGDMTVNTYGMSTLFVQNYEKFSFRAAFAQTEVQKKTAGSLLYGPYLNFVQIKADSSLIPYDIRDKYQLKNNIVKGLYGSGGVMGGYAFSLIMNKRFFFTGALAVGYGLNYGNTTYETPNERINEDVWNTGFKLNSRAALGYNNRRYFIGVSAVIESYNIAIEDDSSELYWMGQFRVNIVKRFDWGVPPLDWIMDRLPILKNSANKTSDR
ncbi:DUF4421 domain-containing protein [Flammeovirga sp. EKP202]|uniref:DUF4421 domain-containing protein n=1 Tax=Flammeovirga sp. EKP202 TaxID=2770592 RepID=UPI00165F4F1A|nr:DUF4421 domain-containing protein [Flammeovirga sp. EKP202]MBD0401277.1 DUF4421 domain-containing protein [Flammeovirga sp. EKP202]